MQRSRQSPCFTGDAWALGAWLGCGHSDRQMGGQAEPELFLGGVHRPLTWKGCLLGVGVRTWRQIPASIFLESALSHCRKERICVVTPSTSGLAGPSRPVLPFCSWADRVTVPSPAGFWFSLVTVHRLSLSQASELCVCAVTCTPSVILDVCRGNGAAATACTPIFIALSTSPAPVQL